MGIDEPPRPVPPPPPSEPAGGPISAGWYPDPYGSPFLRYWDGTVWTGHTHQPATSDAPRPSGQNWPRGTVGRRGLRVLSGWLQGLLWCAGVAGGLFGIVGLSAVDANERFRAGEATALEVLEAEDALVNLEVVWFVVFVIAAVLWIVWLWRTHRQVAAVAGSAGRHGRGWTIGAWVVPIANLWIPKQLHDDLHRACDGRTTGPVPALFHWWWAAWLLSWLLGNAASGSWLPPEGLIGAPLTAYYALNAAWGASELAVAVLAVFVVRHLSGRADQAAETAGVPDW